ncbi:hypothetical protein [Nakamurella sp.]|uniref:hypothetical protein n=1 Tax=Nakamurella sp. TaxID=1869182 RepID=UPI003B3A8AEB
MTHPLDRRPWSDDDLDRALDDLLQFGITASPEAGRSADRSRSRRRWAAPLAAAAAVAAVLAAVSLSGAAGSGAADTARVLSVRSGIADVGGARFPVPPGWTVAVTAADDDAVTACLAPAPAPACDGVQVVMATPGGPMLPDSVIDNVFGAVCPNGGGGYIRAEPEIQLGGRAAVHYFGGSCTLDGPTAHAWITNDRTLAVTTPTGRWAAEGAAVANGLDLTQWPRPEGIPLVSRVMGTTG